jgi:hypothetical protein
MNALLIILLSPGILVVALGVMWLIAFVVMLPVNAMVALNDRRRWRREVSENRQRLAAL